MGAADLDDIAPFMRLRRDRVGERPDPRQQMIADLDDRRDVHGGGKRVVRRLAHIDVVVGMDRRLAAELAADELDRAVGYDLVDVHVRLGTGSRLPDIEREFTVELAGDYLIGDTADDLFLPSRQQPERGV